MISRLRGIATISNGVRALASAVLCRIPHFRSATLQLSTLEMVNCEQLFEPGSLILTLLPVLSQNH